MPNSATLCQSCVITKILLQFNVVSHLNVCEVQLIADFDPYKPCLTAIAWRKVKTHRENLRAAL